MSVCCIAHFVPLLLTPRHFLPLASHIYARFVFPSSILITRIMFLYFFSLASHLDFIDLLPPPPSFSLCSTILFITSGLHSLMWVSHFCTLAALGRLRSIVLDHGTRLSVNESCAYCRVLVGSYSHLYWHFFVPSNVINSVLFFSFVSRS